MNAKNLPSNTVQETMLGPLWARATYSLRYPNLLKDQDAVRILPQINYDFSKMPKILGEWRSIGLLIRARTFDDALRTYLVDHPSATVVNVGAGLDTTFSRVDNGRLRWYDIDLPDAVAFRKQFIPETARSSCIAKSAFDISWLKEIDYRPELGIFIIAGGLVYYFPESEVRGLLTSFTERFPGGEMVFDVVSHLAARIANRRAEKHSESSVRFHFPVGNPSKVFGAWSPKLHVKEWHVLGTQIPIDPNWEKKTRKMVRVTRILKTAKIVHLKFG